LHLLNRNTNVTTLHVGPDTLVPLEHEKVVLGPEKMVIVPSRQYAIILNPVVRKDDIEETNEKKEKKEEKRKKKRK